jgi:hypothetical protein
MKKLIFTLASFSLTLSAVAQTPGYSGTGVYDDIATFEEYSDPNDNGNTPNGIYWSDNPAAQGVCAASVMNRNIITQKEEFTLKSAANCWDPNIFVSFQGAVNAKGLNLTNNSTFSFSFKNAGDSLLDVYVDIVDETNNAVNVDADGKPYVVLGVAAGQTVTISGDFAGGYKSVDGKVTTGFHFNNVTGMEITAINHNVNNETDWEPLALPANYKVSVAAFKLGAMAGTNTVNEISTSYFSVYPNPVQEGNSVSFSQTLNNVSVYNALGELVSFKVIANKLNTSSLSTGLYYIKSEQGISKLIIQ